MIPGWCSSPARGLLEVSGHAAGPPGRSVLIWIQARDVHAEHVRLAAAGVPIAREPAAEPWGLIEMWIEDPDGVRIVLVEVPADHPLRRDPRPALPLTATRRPHDSAFDGKCSGPAPALSAAVEDDHLKGGDV
jgi:Glyoxalase/Bleomycin resistance protein/Dioxygenase superfamily